MGHAEVLELIELAALEPGGLERLAAGDTPEAAAVAGHLAGCADCRAELAATSRAAAVAADAIRELPDPALKARTLAFVREVGVDRSGRAAAPAPPVAPTPEIALPAAPAPAVVASPAPAVAADPAAAASAEPVPSNVVPMTRPSRRVTWWTTASVAAVLIAGVAGFAVGGSRVPAPGDDIVTVMSAAKTTMHIAEQPDAAHFALASTNGDMSGGTVLFSASTGELSMTATGLKAVQAGATYACWVEVDGQRRKIGVLYIEGTDGTWAGWVDGLDKLGAHPVFGVSLVKGGDASGTPILRGGANP